MLKTYTWIVIPIIISLVMSVCYVLFMPGDIKGDAIEYEGLAHSLLQGNYSLDGSPSMEREPGYPLFRALIKLMGSNTNVILFFQILLYCLTIYCIGKTSIEIDPVAGRWGFAGASLSYGLAFYSSTHISEILIAFLLSLIGFTLIRGLRNPSTTYWMYISILCSLLVLTRYPYILIPIAFLSIMTKTSYDNRIEKKKILKNILLSIAIMTMFISPWLVRNYSMFNDINIAGRSGAGLYARAWKAEKPWRSVADSYASALLGRGILFTIYPSNQSIWLEQWGEWWRNPEIVKLWGKTSTERDAHRKKNALEILFKNSNTFSKFIAWSGIDLIRFLQIPNPAPQAYGASFEGTYGPLAQEGTISTPKLFGLSIVHIIQLIWFILIIVSLYSGFKKYTFKFLPGVFLLCVLLTHSIADDVARYGAPLQPWILSGIFMTIIFPFFHNKIHSKKTTLMQ